MLARPDLRPRCACHYTSWEGDRHEVRVNAARKTLSGNRNVCGWKSWRLSRIKACISLDNTRLFSTSGCHEKTFYGAIGCENGCLFFIHRSAEKPTKQEINSKQITWMQVGDESFHNIPNNWSVAQYNILICLCFYHEGDSDQEIAMRVVWDINPIEIFNDRTCLLKEVQQLCSITEQPKEREHAGMISDNDLHECIFLFQAHHLNSLLCEKLGRVTSPSAFFNSCLKWCKGIRGHCGSKGGRR